MSSLKVQRTYGSRNRQLSKSSAIPPSSPPSTLSSSPPVTPGISRPSKRPISEITSSPSSENAAPLFPPPKRLKSLPKPGTSATASKKGGTKAKPRANASKSTQKTLTQLHFNIDQTILRNCSLCDLSYTKGAPDDEALHRTHCARVRQGMEWGREEEKDRMRSGKDIVTEVSTDIKLKGGKKKGRILSFPSDVGGKLGTKLTTLLQTINLALSSPDLPPSVLQCSKAYLFLIPHDTQSHRERIVGCVIAQRITTAMAVVPSSFILQQAPSTTDLAKSSEPSFTVPTSEVAAEPAHVVVDTTTQLLCSPTPLPTPMGISRLFVSSSHRRLGVAHSLLDAAAATFIYGCPLNPRAGEVAFSQPTGMGQGVMKSWGGGSVRVFEEC